jgi:hypothetical protein
MGKKRDEFVNPRHGTLYRSKEILPSYQEAQRGMETISIDRGALLDNLFHLNTDRTMKNGLKTWTTMRLNKCYHNMSESVHQTADPEE